METTADYQQELAQEYVERFASAHKYRQQIWTVLTRHFFSRFVSSDSTVLDLGCGWGEFINNIDAGTKYGLDLNPDAARHLNSEVHFFCQDCTQTWPLADESLDAVFTSNFFEHIRDKDALRRTLQQAKRCLRPGGRIICMGPNIKFLDGEYWDFWDHYLPLTELSLKEILTIVGFEVSQAVPRFLPYTMVGKRQSPLFLVRAYLSMPFVWRFFGKQFLVVARKP